MSKTCRVSPADDGKACRKSAATSSLGQHHHHHLKTSRWYGDKRADFCPFGNDKASRPHPNRREGAPRPVITACRTGQPQRLNAIAAGIIDSSGQPGSCRVGIGGDNGINNNSDDESGNALHAAGDISKYLVCRNTHTTGDMSAGVNSMRLTDREADEQREECYFPLNYRTPTASRRHHRASSSLRMSRERVVINVGGEKFVTWSSTLTRTPDNRLFRLTMNDPAYDHERGEYFFDRNSRLFPYVLDYCRTGELHFPHDLCGPLIKREMEFWQIGEDTIAQCCWKTFKEFEEQQKTLEMIDATFSVRAGNPYGSPTAADGGVGGGDGQAGRVQTYFGCTKWCHDVWLFLEDPTSSMAAQIWAYVYIGLVMVAIGVICLETHPDCRRSIDEPPSFDALLRNSTNPKLIMYLTTDPHPILVTIDYVLTFVFAFELLLKFVVWPGKLSFFKSFFNIMDLLAVVPLFVNAVGNLIKPWFWIEADLFSAYLITSMTCIFRAVRLLKLVKHNRGLQVMLLAMRASVREIMLLFLLMVIGTLIFSTMIYFAEFSERDSFLNIPVGFWWAIITMTTVGYGDVTPKTGAGYAVGSMCAVWGMLITGLPIPVIANSFRFYYTYAGVRSRLKRQKKEEKGKEDNKESGGLHKTSKNNKAMNLCVTVRHT